MSSVRELLLKQKAEITGRMEPLYARCRDLRKSLIEAESNVALARSELHQIEQALEALDKAKAKSGPITIMQAVLMTLKHNPSGMTAQEILAEINAKYFDGKIVRPSLSPQLSRLKDRDKKIELRGNRWFPLPDEPTLFAPKS